MKKILLAMVMVLMLGLTAPVSAFQWLIELEPCEVVEFSTPYPEKAGAVNLALMRELMKCPSIETPEQARAYFHWVFGIDLAIPQHEEGESAQEYGNRLGEYFRTIFWIKILTQPVSVECDDKGCCVLINNTGTTMSFPYNCLLPLLEE